MGAIDAIAAGLGFSAPTTGSGAGDGRDAGGAPSRGRGQDRAFEEDSRDRIDLTQAAAFAIAAAQADPRRMSLAEAGATADLLARHGAIGRVDHDALGHGPDGGRAGVALPDIDQPVDMIALWQERLGRALGQDDARAVDRASRALSVLARLEASRGGP